MEVEEELHRQGMSQEEIDEQMEEIASNYQNEINKKQEKEEEPNLSEELEKLDLESKKQNSSAEQCDQIELTSALSSEKKVEPYENIENKENLEVLKPELDAMESESDEEEDELLQELYRRETSRRPIYARQKSKGYSKWLEQRELRSEKIKNSKSESEKKKEIEEESWKTTLKQWIKEASEEECNAELKSELKKAFESYNEFEDLTRKFLELYEKGQNEKLTEIEKNRLKFLTERLQGLSPIQLELLANIRAIKKYIIEQYWWDTMNRFLDYRMHNNFFKLISQKYENLKKENKVKELWMEKHKVTFSSGYSYEYYYTNQMTTYKIKNKTNEEKELYLDHPKTHGYKFVEKPNDPEETPNYWRFKLKLKPKDAVNFKLKEQREDYSSNYLWNWSKDDILKRVGFYIKHKFIDEKLEAKLKEIAEFIQTLNDKRNKRENLDQERDLMTDEQSRLRENISVLGDDSQSISLKERYVKKLNDQETRFEKISVELKKLDKEIDSLNKKIEKQMNKLKA